MKGLSLVMATIGRQDEPIRFVDSIARQTCGPVELIIVDQNPDERLVRVVAQARNAGIPCLHIRQPHPDLCAARNAGLAAATLDLVAFPDDDCWYEPDVVEQTLRQFDSDSAVHAVVAKWIEMDCGIWLPHTLDADTYRHFKEVDTSSITLFFRRELLHHLGGFDPAFGLHSWYGSGEETDLMLRLMATKARVRYTSDIRVHHHTRTCAVAPFRQEMQAARRRARGTGGLYIKHHIPARVILRGLLAPWIRAACPPYRAQPSARLLGQALGRLEGYLRRKAAGVD